MSTIRILHMIGSLNIGGSQSMVMNLYRNIDRNKVQFDFIIDHPTELFFAEEIKKLGGRIYCMPSFNGRNIVKVINKWKEFFVEHNEYKIVHSHIRSYAALYIPIAKRSGLVTIIHSHSTSSGNGIKGFVKSVLQYPLRYQADYFFGCSREAGEWLFGKRVINGNRYFMIQNAVDIEKYQFNSEVRNRYRMDLNVEADAIVFAHVGRFHPAKNHIFLLEVFAAVHSIYMNSILVLVGDGDLRSEIEHKISVLHLESSVRLLGNRSDVSNLLQAADCFLFPSKWEGLPVTVIEAQAAGLPCLISSNVTEDAFISALAMKIPIVNGIECWVDAILNTDFSRKDVSSQIIQSGFDAKTVAEWMSNFYIENCK